MVTCSDDILLKFVVVSAVAPLIIPSSAHAGKLYATITWSKFGIHLTLKYYTILCSQRITSALCTKIILTVLPPKAVCALPSHFCPERLAREPASKGHTGGRSRKSAKPAGPLLCTTFIKSDFCARTIEVALRVVNKFNYNNVSRAGPTLK